MTLDFNAAVTALFPKGRYTYDVDVTHGYRTTIAHSNKVVVE